MKEWDLSKLYTSFNDPNFINDFNKIITIQDQINTYRNHHDVKALENYLKDTITINEMIEKLANFISLTLSVDTTNKDALKYSDQLDTLLASFVEDDTLNQQWIASFALDTLDSKLIKEHLFILKEIQQNQKYTLDKKSESIIAHMQNTGSNAFSKLKDQLISSIEVNIDNQKYPLTEVLNMAYSKDKDMAVLVNLLRIKKFFAERGGE